MSERLSYAEMAVELEKMMRAKQTWLHSFSGGKQKRPDFEIDTKRRERAVLDQAADDYRRAAKRKSV